MEALAQNNLGLFAKIVACSGATEAMKATTGKVTVLAPTDAAITSFLKSMGLSAQQVVGEEALCDTLLRYHVLPYILKSSMLVRKDMTAQTLQPFSYLTFNKDASGVTVKDMQGNVAKVTKGDITAGEGTLHIVDRVLLSGNVFYTVGDAFKYHDVHHSELFKALKTAGLLGAVMDSKKPFTGTIFAPTNAAFKALTIKPTPDQLKDILRYHVLKEEIVLPADLKAGAKYATFFPGHTVQIKMSTGTAKDVFGQTQVAGFVDVIPEAGKPGRVKKHNVFAGQGVIHGIDTVLLPKLGGAVTEKAAVQGHHHRRLLQRGDGVNMDFKNAGALDDTAGAISDAASGQSSAGLAAKTGSATTNAELVDGY